MTMTWKEKAETAFWIGLAIFMAYREYAWIPGFLSQQFK